MHINASCKVCIWYIAVQPVGPGLRALHSVLVKGRWEKGGRLDEYSLTEIEGQK
jgi:hypothetical protein